MHRQPSGGKWSPAGDWLQVASGPFESEGRQLVQEAERYEACSVGAGLDGHELESGEAPLECVLAIPVLQKLGHEVRELIEEHLRRQVLVVDVQEVEVMVLELGHVLAQDPYCAVVHRWAHGRSFSSWGFTAAMSRHEQAATG